MRIIVSIYDKKLKSFENVVAVEKQEEASRDFETLKTMTETKYGKHPDDFQLYKVGEYNRDNGLLTPITPPELI